jgi:hypothetical protein
MSLQIVAIENNGKASEEYILLRAIQQINLDSFAVVDRTFDKDGNVSNVFRHFYRFPSQIVQKDEYVSLRTGKGTYQYGTLKDGVSPVHRFYWGSDTAVWNDGNVESAEVLKVQTVSRKTTGYLSPNNKPLLKLKVKK